jgi:ERCC4-type nuclease
MSNDYAEWYAGIPAGKPAPPAPSKMDLRGVGQEIYDALVNAGFDSIEKLQTASDEELLSISGIGKGRLESIRAALSEVN